MAGVWGKLGGHGDFLALGLDATARACVVPWLDAALAVLHEEWGAAWPARFDGMGMLGLWIGPAVSGGAPVAGVMAPSRDRVGRRYPLLILGRGEAVPPMLAPGGFHARAGAALAGLLASGQAEAGAWPQDLAEAEPAPVAGDPSLVWARNPGCSGAGLLAEILGYDHAASCAGRVHVWTLAAPGAVLTCDGLPTARALGWLIEASQGEAAATTAAMPAATAGTAGPVDGHSEILAEPAAAAVPPGMAAIGAGTALAGGIAGPGPEGGAGSAPGGGAGAAAPAEAVLRLESRFRLGAEEQADSRLVLRSEWALPEGAEREGEPVDAAVWQLPEALAGADPDTGPARPDADGAGADASDPATAMADAGQPDADRVGADGSAAGAGISDPGRSGADMPGPARPDAGGAGADGAIADAGDAGRSDADRLRADGSAPGSPGAGLARGIG